MTTLLAPAASAKTSTVEIKGASYSVQPIDPGFAGVAAVRVTKLVNPDNIYDVALTEDGRLICDCPDFVARHEDRGTHCKHCKAMIDGGFLVVPVAAPVVELVKETVEQALAIDPDDVESDPSTWPAWCDEDAWTITEAPDFIAEPLPAGSNPVEFQGSAPARTMDDTTFRRWKREQVPAVDADFAELAVGFLTDSALNLIDEGRTGAALAIYDGLEPENRDTFDAFMVTLGKPGLGWLGWLNACQAGSPVGFDGPRPTTRPRFVPTDEDLAEELGWELGRMGENVSAPEGREFGWLVAFYRGWLAGNAARVEAEREELEGWLASLGEPDYEAMYPDFDPHHDAERREAGHAA